MQMISCRENGSVEEKEVRVSKLNPFMAGDLLDKCFMDLDLSYFWHEFWHRFAKYLKERCRQSLDEQISIRYCFCLRDIVLVIRFS